MEPIDHIDEDLIIAYAEDPQTVANRDIVEEHLAGCSSCWKILDDYRTLIAGARDEEMWFAQRTVGEACGDRQSAVLDFAARTAAEDEEAARLLKPFIDSPYLVTSARITRKKRFYTGGVVRALCAAARDACDNDPEYSLHLSDAAQLIAATLPDDYYPASAVNELRGRRGRNTQRHADT